MGLEQGDDVVDAVPDCKHGERPVSLISSRGGWQQWGTDFASWAMHLREAEGKEAVSIDGAEQQTGKRGTHSAIHVRLRISCSLSLTNE